MVSALIRLNVTYLTKKVLSEINQNVTWLV